MAIDYVQLLEGRRTRHKNRNLELSEISRQCKLLAKELRVPLVLLAQLNREAETDDSLPTLAHLRESGALEQDADIVLFVHRPEVFKRTPENAGKAMIIIAKNRNGRTGLATMSWSGEYQQFSDDADRERPVQPADAVIAPRSEERDGDLGF